MHAPPGSLRLRHTIAFRLPTLVIGGLLLTLMAALLVSNLIGRGQMIDLVTESLRATAATEANQIATLLESQYDIVSGLATSARTRVIVEQANALHPADEGALAEHLAAARAAWSAAAGVSAPNDGERAWSELPGAELLARGLPLASGGPSSYVIVDRHAMPVVYSHRPQRASYHRTAWWAALKEGAGGVVAGPSVDLDSPATRVLVFAIPVHDASGQLIGAVYNAFDYSMVSRAIVRGQFAGTGRTALVGSTGEVLYANPNINELNMTTVPVDAASAGMASFVSPAGRDLLMTAVQIESGVEAIRQLHWYVAAVQARSDAYAPLERTLLPGAAAALLVAIVLVGALHSRYIAPLTNDLNRLRVGAEALQQGARDPVVLRRPDELGLLAATFNAMASQLHLQLAQQESAIALATSELRRRAEQLHAAVHVGQAANATFDLELMMARTLELIREQFGYRYACIYLLDSSKRHVVARAATGEHGAAIVQDRSRVAVGADCLVGWVARHWSPRVAVNDGPDAAYFQDDAASASGAEAALPLLSQGELLGVLDVHGHRQQQFVEEDIATLQLLADQIAAAIVNARTFRQTELLTKRQQLVLRLGQRLNGLRDEEAILDTACRQIQEDFGYDAVHVAVGDEVSWTIRHSAGFLTALALPIGLTRPARSGLIGQAISSGQPQLIAHRNEDHPEFFDLDFPAMAGEAAVPINTGNERFGALGVLMEQAGILAMRDLSLLSLLAESIGSAVANVRLLRDLEHNLSELDRLYRQSTHRPGDVNPTPEVTFQPPETPGNLAPQLAMPLLSRGQAIGELTVATARDLNEDDEQLVTAVANQLALAVENSRLFMQTRVRLRETEALLSLAATLSTALEPGEIFERAGRTLAEQLDVAQVNIYSWEPKTDTITVRSSLSRADGDWHAGPWYQSFVLADRPDARQALRTRQARQRVVGAGDGSARRLHRLEVPLAFGGSALGLIEADRETPFPEAEVRLVQAMGNQLAVALQNARLAAETKGRVSQLTTLNRVGQRLAAAPDLEAVFEVVREELMALSEATGLHIYLFDASSGAFHPAFRAFDPALDRLRLAQNDSRNDRLGQYVFRTRQPVVINASSNPRQHSQLRDVLPESVTFSWAGFPLIVSNETVGVLALEHNENVAAFLPDEIGLLTTIANAFAVAVSSQLQLDRTRTALDTQRRQRLQLEAAARVAAAASSILEVEVLMQSAVELIQEAFGLYYAGIYLADYLTNEAVLTAGTGSAGLALRSGGHRVPIGGRGVISAAMADGQARIAHDLHEEPGWEPDPNLPLARSELALPLRVRDFISGALSVQSSRPEHFDRETVQVLQIMADQLAIAINNAQLLRDTKAYSAQLQLAAEVGRAASTILDRETLGKTVVELIRERFGLYHVALFLAEDQHAVFYAGSGGTPRELAGGGAPRILVLDQPGQKRPSTVGVAMARGTAIYEADLSLSPHWSGEALLPETQSVLTLPLMTRGHVVGAISAQSDQTDGFSAEEMAVLEVLADQLAVAFDNAQLFARIEQNLVSSTRQYETGQALIRATDTSTVFRTLVDFARDTGSVSAAGVLLPETSGERATLHNWWSADETSMPANLIVEVTEQIAGPGGPALLEPGTSELSQLTAHLASYTASAAAILPIRAGDEWRGSLVLCRADGKQWDRAELQPFETLVDQTAIILANQRLLAETNALYEISARLNQAITQEDLMNLAVSAVTRHVGFPEGRFILFDPKTRAVTMKVASGEARGPGEREHRATPAAEPATFALLAERRRPVYLPEAASTQATAAFAEQFGHYGTATTWLFPLRSQVQLLGYLALDGVGDRERLRPTQRNFVQAVLRQLNTALENLRLLEDTLQRAQDLISLNQIGALISGTLELETLADVVRTQVARLMPVDGFLMALCDESGETVHYVHATRDDEPLTLHGRRLALDDPLREFLHAGMPVIGTPETQLVRSECARMEQPPSASSLWMPLWREQTPIGYLAVQSGQRHAYEDGHLHLFRSISTQASLAVTNAQLFQQTQDNIAELRRLLLVSQATASSVDASERLQATVEALDEALPGADAAIYRVDQEDEQRLALVATSRADAFRQWLPLEQALAPEGAGAAWSPEAGKNGHADDEARSGLVVPLRLGQRMVGAVAVQHVDERPVVETERRLLQALSSSLASTLESGRLFAEIQAANQRLREIDRLKSQFLANMSHELRTPLNSIIGFSKLMLKGIDGPITEAQEEDLSSIHHSGQHLLRLINDILDMSKIEAGKLVLQFESVDLADTAQQAIAVVTPLLAERPVSLRTKLASELPAIEADPIRLRQILLNLLSNAAKFTQEGWIELGIRPDGANQVHITVTDTGPGIAEEQFDLLFREFEQLSNSATEETGGTGLGLPITRRLVEMHGGRIWVESQVGEGSTFHVALPLRQAENAPTEAVG